MKQEDDGELLASLDYTRPHLKRVMPTQTIDVISWLLFIFVIIRNSGVFRWLTFLGKLHGGEPGEVVYACNNGNQKAETRTVSTYFLPFRSPLYVQMWLCARAYGCLISPEQTAQKINVQLSESLTMLISGYLLGTKVPAYNSSPQKVEAEIQGHPGT